MSVNQIDPRTLAAQGKAATAGLLLARFIVPLWVLMGASVKLIEQSPRLLPEYLRKAIDNAGVDLHIALAVFITIEFAAVALMVFVPKVARPTAIFMLGSFCLVLIWEMINGNVTQCGCLASISPPPWVMLSIDGLLLVGVCALPVRRILEPDARAGWALASLVAIAIGAVSFMRMPSDAITVPVHSGDAVATEHASDDASAQTQPNGNTPQMSLPAYYQPPVESWIGQPIDSIDLVQWTAGLPADLKEGRRYLIYFSHTCEHCFELLLTHFDFDLPAPTTLVAIPETIDGFEEDGHLENPCIDCGAVLKLPVGVDWLMTPPIVIAIEDGIVHCAQEAEDVYEPQCLPWHGF